LRKTVEKRPDEGAFPGEERVAAKFRALAGHVLPADQVRRIEETVLSLDHPGDVAALVDLLTNR
jgi:hypothetical protein